MRRMQPGDHMAYIFENLPVSQVGAILAHLDNHDLLATLDQSFNVRPRLLAPASLPPPPCPRPHLLAHQPLLTSPSPE